MYAKPQNTDPREKTLRKALRDVERKYDRASEAFVRGGRIEGPAAARLRQVGAELDRAQKALDEYLAR